MRGSYLAEPTGNRITALGSKAAIHHSKELIRQPRRIDVAFAVQRLGVQHELPALGRGDRGYNRDLAAELIWRSGLAFADALHLGGVQRVDLEPALARPRLSLAGDLRAAPPAA